MQIHLAHLFSGLDIQLNELVWVTADQQGSLGGHRQTFRCIFYLSKLGRFWPLFQADFMYAFGFEVGHEEALLLLAFRHVVPAAVVELEVRDGDVVVAQVVVVSGVDVDLLLCALSKHVQLLVEDGEAEHRICRIDRLQQAAFCNIYTYIQLRLGRQRQIWLIPLADVRGVCR